MSDRLYRTLLRLYPKHFREAYGEEALQLFRDRLSAETGPARKARFWFDIFLDFGRSLPAQYLSHPDALTAMAYTDKPVLQFASLEGDSPRSGAIWAAIIITPFLLASVVMLGNSGHVRRRMLQMTDQQNVAFFRSHESMAGGLAPEKVAAKPAADSVHLVVQRIISLVDQRYSDAQGSKQIAEALTQAERTGNFRRPQKLDALAAVLTRTIRVASHNKGFQVVYDPFSSASGKPDVYSAYPLSSQLALVIPASQRRN